MAEEESRLQEASAAAPITTRRDAADERVVGLRNASEIEHGEWAPDYAAPNTAARCKSDHLQSLWQRSTPSTMANRKYQLFQIGMKAMDGEC